MEDAYWRRQCAPGPPVYEGLHARRRAVWPPRTACCTSRNRSAEPGLANGGASRRLVIGTACRPRCRSRRASAGAADRRASAAAAAGEDRSVADRAGPGHAGDRPRPGLHRPPGFTLRGGRLTPWLQYVEHYHRWRGACQDNAPLRFGPALSWAGSGEAVR